MGVARTFQNIRLFNALTAVENVKIGVESHQKTGPIGAMLRLPRARREERESDAEAFRLLEFVGLRKQANEISSSLPYGDQRRLEIARAMGTRPRAAPARRARRRHQPGREAPARSSSSARSPTAASASCSSSTT